MSMKKANRAAEVNNKMEPSRQAKLEIEGKARGNAALRLNADPRFTTFLTHQELCDRLLILEHALDNYNPTKAREKFIADKKQALDEYFKEEVQKVADEENLAKMAVEEGKRLLMENLVPFVLVDGLEKRAKWTDKISDDVTQHQSPTVLEMLLEVCPSLENIDCITRTEKFMEWLTNDFANHEDTWRQERKLSERQKEDHVEKTFKVTITCKPILQP